tara:strand:- start:14995 stop:17418 length:2424 start_codon:yes stop_codon:yes gene_type:complete
MGYYFPQQKLSKHAKKKNDFAWAKAVIDELDRQNTSGYDGASDNKRKKVNYDLFNGKLDIKDFEYVCKPYGNAVGEMPAEIRHYDIMSPKLRVLFGEEIKRPFNFKVITTNSEAISEKEREKSRLLEKFILAEVQRRIQKRIQEELNPQEQDAQDPEAQQAIQQQAQQIEQEMTPPQIEEYMKRDYLDIKEIQASQILQYLKKKLAIREKFNKGWKHALIAGEEVYWVGVVNGEPEFRTVNPLYFEYDKDPDIDYIQDGQWAKYTMRMTPGSVVDTFGKYMKEKDIAGLYEGNTVVGSANALGSEVFNYNDEIFTPTFEHEFDESDSTRYIKVVHCEWKSLKKIGFLKYYDEDGEEQEMIVDETYKFDEKKGDLDLKWEWIPEIWEGTKIGTDLYVNMRPKPNQHRDLDNLHECKLGYYGLTYNNLNSESISMIDRMKPYQYMYNIIMYRLELDLASDRGKKFLADINQIPSSMGMDMDKWLYYFDAMGIAWINPQEEGKRNQQSNFNQWNALDLTMAQSVQQKVQLLEYLEMQCGEVSGVTKQREGQVGPNELVGNTQQAVVQSSHITEELFYLHNSIKGHVLEGLIDNCKMAWSSGKSKKVQYVLDDMSISMLSVDTDNFANASYGVFVADSAKDQELFLTLKQLAHAAVQNQRAELSDLIKVLSTESSAEIKSLLESAEEKRVRQEQEMQQQQMQQQQQIAQMQEQTKQQEMQFDKYKVDTDNDTKLKIAEMNLMGKIDQNGNGIPDILEAEKIKQQREDSRMKYDDQAEKNAIKRDEIKSKERIEKEKAKAAAVKAKQQSKKS